ncbi:MAG: 4-hydroxy-3-methylbut-2-enyl diphosphate reductase [Sphaerochaeta sp.]|nr:4-hydroxy-3-methylbut-2-enyl diphosphate reductase [Sphaerochaeta sp.]
MSQTMGYCTGVSRALAMAERAIAQATEQAQPVYSLGKLIHNRQVNERLSSKGLGEIDRADEGEAGLVVVRAHGIPDDLREEFTTAGHQLIDATCPVVKHNLRRIAHYCTTHKILIVGHKDHPETVAMQGVRNDGELCRSRLITSVEEVGAPICGERYAVFVQTTFDEIAWSAIKVQLAAFSDSASEVVFVNDVCSSSINRRSALIKLTEECDAIIVIGGKNSANTRALYHLAVESGVKAWHIEDERDVLPQMFECDILGITAGASTPVEVIDAVVRRLEQEQS